MTHIAIQEADDDRVDAYWREHVEVTTHTATPDAPPLTWPTHRR